jgi:hypothetical protein
MPSSAASWLAPVTVLSNSLLGGYQYNAIKLAASTATVAMAVEGKDGSSYFTTFPNDCTAVPSPTFSSEPGTRPAVALGPDGSLYEVFLDGMSSVVFKH